MPANPADQGESRHTTGGTFQQAPPPTLSLPKGGGAIRGIGEKVAANPVTGTASATVPIATSPGRSGFGPQLTLTYDSGSGNGPFGLGWSLSLPAITRKTDKGLPQYDDREESDGFLLSGAEDLVPALRHAGQGQWVPDELERDGYRVRRYRPRTEGLFARIERWTHLSTGEIHWRSISRDDITTLYGTTNNSRIFDPAGPDPEHPSRIFSWLICASYDDKGNAAVYEYQSEDSHRIFEDPDGQPVALAHEHNRTDAGRSANRYLKRIRYGNRAPNRDAADWQPADPALLPGETWMFDLVFDYGEGHYADDAPDAQGRVFARAQIAPPAGSHWPARQDRFSTYRAGFEVRTYRLCRRVLMFHHFPEELGIPDCLVRSTEFSYSESPVASFITAVTQSGYVRRPAENQPNRYLKQSLPPLEFEYSQVPSPEQLAQRPVRDIDPASLENLPVGLDDSGYQWMDLDGEGSSGILTEQDGGWYYKRNLSANNRLPEDGHEVTLARFAPVELVATQPAAAPAGGTQFLDLAGDGQVDLVQMEGPARGYYERTADPGWAPFQPFTSWPGVDIHDPNLRFVDLTGDGHADILVTKGDVVTWHPSLGEAGFGPARGVSLPWDEERGPRLLFADGTQSVHLADMSGDGLGDLVRIRNGEVCYWPNQGYGRFGPNVTMDHSPWFDAIDHFDPRRLRLADTDGSGTTDLVYLRGDGAQLYFNQSGNGWSDPVTLPQFPPVDHSAGVHALDLLGTGTACLVWSSPLPGATRRPARYLALMDEKPHLLTGVQNNLGAGTRVHYATSTKFYLDDLRDGRPWVTRLPFPVHLVERVETYDYISRSRFVTRYAYHHGYFDGEEREFRGFGRVDQWDTEEMGAAALEGTTLETTNWDAASVVPPVQTRTWFHTGAYFEGGRVSKQFEHEYYREGDASRGESGLSDQQLGAMLLEDTALPAMQSLADGTQVPFEPTAEECRQACRSLKGAILRQEIYGLDGTDAADRPYSVSERNYTIQCLQPQGQNRHAVFFAHLRETLDFHYERRLFKVAGGLLVDPESPPPNARDAADPRVTHGLTLEVDHYGNVLRSVAIGYGRRYADPSLAPVDQARQAATLATVTESVFTNAVLEADAYRTPLLCESRAYEAVNLSLDPAQSLSDITNLFRFGAVVDQLDQAGDGSHDLPYEDIQHSQATTGAPYRRLIEHTRTLYRKNDLTGFSPLGTVESLALPGESYQLAYTASLLQNIFIDSGKLAPADIPQALGVDGGYVHAAGDPGWWAPAGQVFFSPAPDDPAAAELAFARAHFFLVHRYRDPFGNDVVLAYDSDATSPSRNHNLLLVESSDPLGNVVTVRTQDDDGAMAICNDYRVLRPYWVTDPNHNRTRVLYDALGMAVATAAMGKPGEGQGDNLINIALDLTQAETDALHDASDPHTMAPALLGSASLRIVYDLHRFRLSRAAHPGDPARWEAPYGVTLARETHAGDPLPPQGLRVRISFSFSDGFGREIQKKLQAEPGPAPQRDAAGQIVVGADGQPVMTAGAVSPRWVGSGWMVLNNKGQPVRKYEPFFTDTHRFEFDVRIGVSPVYFYDPAGRAVATLHPNHTWDKVVFDPWRQTTWDVNDTVLIAGPGTDADAGGFFSRLPGDAYLPVWYDLRQGGALGTDEQAAAQKSAVHAATPPVAHLDTLGRMFLTVAHNRFKYSNTAAADPPVAEFYRTSVILDIEGNQREVIDAEGRAVMRYDYDLLGRRVHQAGMEAGERWLLRDVAGNGLYGWDSRDHEFRSTYDALRRPVESFVRESGGAALLVERRIYGETVSNPVAANLRGQVVQLFDQAGIVTSDGYDFKGNLLQGRRRLAREYKAALDWAAAVPLDSDTYASSARYDALNRPVELTAPDGSFIRPAYNEANLLERLEVNLRGAQQNGQPVWTPFVLNIDYDAKGQRTRIEYGNGVTTTYAYDPLTFRLAHLLTRRSAAAFPGDCPQPPPAGWPGCQVQNLRYTYDPAGNITHIRDEAQQTVYFRNRRVEPSGDYTYDALYRLIEATGREHLGQVGGTPIPHSHSDAPRVGIDWSANDGHAMGTYLERYLYDAVGNFLQLQHRGADPAAPGWTRAFAYGEASLIEPLRHSNRLMGTTTGADTETYSAGGDGYDPHGNMLRMPQLQVMQWDFKNQLQMTQRQAVSAADADGLLHQGERTWYVYDAAGQRVRKVTERQNGTRHDERLYFAGFEIYRRYGETGTTATLERETLHITDGRQRVALVETKTVDAGKPPDTLPNTLMRYQSDNHLGSAMVELDGGGELISYEEYYPYGSTAYQAVRSDLEVSPRRYRYTAKERDEETGFYYQGARYYAPWLGRWTSADPKGLVDGVNLYQYVNGNPLLLFDPAGTQAEEKRPAPSTWEQVKGFAMAVLILEATSADPSGKIREGAVNTARIAKGAAIGVGEMAAGVARAFHEPEAAAEDIAAAAKERYERKGGGVNGAVAAINIANPVSHGVEASQALAEAALSGNPEEYGRQAVRIVIAGAAVAGMAGGAAGGPAPSAGAVVVSPKGEAAIAVGLAVPAQAVPVLGGLVQGVVTSLAVAAPPGKPKPPPKPATRPARSKGPIVKAGKLSEAEFRKLMAEQPGVYVYRLVDQQGNIIKWGTTENPFQRIAKKDYKELQFSEMQVVTGPHARFQSLAGETEGIAIIEQEGAATLNVRTRTTSEMKGGVEWQGELETPPVAPGTKPLISIVKE